MSASGRLADVDQSDSVCGIHVKVGSQNGRLSPIFHPQPQREFFCAEGRCRNRRVRQLCGPSCHSLQGRILARLKRVAIILIRATALDLCFRMSFFPKPVPTFGRQALGWFLRGILAHLFQTFCGRRKNGDNAVSTGRRKFQKTSLRRSGFRRWSSLAHECSSIFGTLAGARPTLVLVPSLTETTGAKSSAPQPGPLCAKPLFFRRDQPSWLWSYRPNRRSG